MTLSAGSKLGPYEVLSPLGAGGMGEVYRARDSRLGRDVAIKVLPAALAASPEARQRFEREAQTISQLAHPHICALYDVGREGDTEYLVMELLEGETLSDRLAKGPLPLEQTLRFGQEIADALDKAHRQGIVHRDLKPGNVMLTKSGVKLLDFGLARAVEPAAEHGSLTSLPTQRALTQEGTILGTFQYMAPEQLEGRPADERTDIFAFGAVLYEMATGRKAFSGATQASLITAIMSAEPPPLSSVQPASPPSLDRIVKTCLAKDPEERWQSAGDLKRELRWVAEGSSSIVASGATPGRRSRGRAAAPWKVAAIVLGLTAGALAVLLARKSVPTAQRLRFAIAAPPATSFLFAGEEVAGPPALSPDGRWLVFTATDAASKSRLWLRAMDSLEARPIAGTDNGSQPFWSPDSRSIGFFADKKLKKVAVAGGAPDVLCDTGLFMAFGGSWSSQGTILYALGDGSLRQWRVGEGQAREVPGREGAEKGQRLRDSALSDAVGKVGGSLWPYFLPDGDHFLYLGGEAGTTGEASRVGIYVGSLSSKQSKHLLPYESRPVYDPTGRILAVSEGNLLSVAFDARRLEIRGEPVRVAEGVGTDPILRNAFFTASANGILVFQKSEAAPGLSRLTWIDRSGRPLGTVGEPRVYGAVRLSPDGRRAAVEVWNQEQTKEIWLADFSGGVEQRLIYGDWSENPVWSRDGARIAYARAKNGEAYEIREREVFGSGRDEVLASPGRLAWSDDWAPDGRSMLMTSLQKGKRRFTLDLFTAADRKVTPWLETDADERDPSISPDGRWEAHGSNESGVYEIYVRPFPGPGGKRQISRSTGSQARWRGDGRELYYLSPDGKMMAVEAKTSPSAFEAGAPTPLFEAPVARPQLFPATPFDVTPDGHRFLVVCPVGGPSSAPLTAVVNWAEGLERVAKP